MSEIKFWYHLPVTQSVEYILKCAKKGEEVGFDAVSHQDHLIWESEDKGCTPEMWTLLTTVAATTSLTVSPLVMCNLFRNPALVAKAVATIDQLSRGRVYLAVGADWWEEEFRAYGYKWMSGKKRVDRAIESTDIIKKLWTQERVDYDGRFWRIENCSLVPRPYTDPHPLIWNGGSGRRMLRMTARLCDGWITGISDPETFLEKRKEILDHADGREILFGKYLCVQPGKLGFPEAQGQIEELVDAGVTHFMVMMRPDADNLEMLDQCEDLISNFR